MNWSHARRMAQAQAQLNKRPGTGGAYSAPTTAGAATAAPTTPRGYRSQVNGNTLAAILGLVALLVLYFGVYTSSWSQVGIRDLLRHWSWDHAFWLVVFWGLVAAPIAILFGGTRSRALQKILATVVIAVFIIAPVMTWYDGYSKSPASAGPAPAEQVATPQARIPLVTDERWPQVTLQPGDKKFFRTPGEYYLRAEVVTGAEKSLVLFNEYRDGRPDCPHTFRCSAGPLRGNTVVNVGTEEITIEYAFGKS